MQENPAKPIRVNGAFDSDIAIATVIPTYNEAENIRNIVEQLFALDLPKLGILFVDDSSIDGTGEIADCLSQKHADDW